MLLINNQPVGDKALKNLLDIALQGRDISNDSVIEFKLNAWRPNPEYDPSAEAKDIKKKFLGPMYLGIPEKYRAKDLTNPQAIQDAEYRYSNGEPAKDDMGKIISGNGEIEFIAGHIRFDAKQLPDLYVFLKLNPLCFGGPNSKGPGEFTEINVYKDRIASFDAKVTAAARVAEIYNMPFSAAHEIVQGLHLLNEQDLQTEKIVRGALIQFAEDNAKMFDTLKESKTILLQVSIKELCDKGVLQFALHSRKYSLITESGEGQDLYQVPEDGIALKEKHFAEHLLEKDKATLKIIRNLAEE